MPKYKLLLGAGLGIVWEEAEVLRSLAQLSAAAAGRYRAYRRAVEEERSLDPLRVSRLPCCACVLRIGAAALCVLQHVHKACAVRAVRQLGIGVAAASSLRNACGTCAHWLWAVGCGAAPSLAQVRIAREFVPPGEVIWLQRSNDTKPPPPRQPASSAGHAAAAAAKAPQPQSSAEAALAAGRTPHARGIGGGSSVAARLAAAAPSGVLWRRPVSRLTAHFTDGLSVIVGGMVVSRTMFRDHLPDAQLAQLKKFVARLQVQQANGLLGPGCVVSGVCSERCDRVVRS